MRERRPDDGDERAELDAVRPYLGLAREIHEEVTRLAGDPAASGALLGELLERIPIDKRMELARRVFASLPADEQWSVLERVYGDDELRRYLSREREAARADAQRMEGRARLRHEARRRRALDTTEVEPGDELTLGLVREDDARVALARGRTSSTCARRVVLRSLGAGRFQVVEDVFNPNGSYFVTGAYTAEMWRDHDRLEPHAVVRVGATTPGEPAPSFAPVLHPGGRVDVEIDGRAIPGSLHLGFAMVGDVDIFVP